jgi:hypothetical protein
MCFGPICRAIFRLIFRQVEYTIDNAFNLRDLVLQQLVQITDYIRNFLYMSLKMALQVGPKHVAGIII